MDLKICDATFEPYSCTPIMTHLKFDHICEYMLENKTILSSVLPYESRLQCPYKKGKFMIPKIPVTLALLEYENIFLTIVFTN